MLTERRISHRDSLPCVAECVYYLYTQPCLRRAIKQGAPKRGGGGRCFRGLVLKTGALKGLGFGGMVPHSEPLVMTTSTKSTLERLCNLTDYES